MAKNRRDVPREDRVAEILSAARERFVHHGYRATSIGDIARDIGVASGAIHWYFPTKDNLFAATFADIVAERPKGGSAGEVDDPQATLVEFLTDKVPYQTLHHDAHTLLQESNAVAEVHDQLHEHLNELLLRSVSLQLPSDTELGIVDDLAHYLLEGLLTTHKHDRSIEDVISFAVDALVAAAKAQNL